MPRFDIIPHVAHLVLLVSVTAQAQPLRLSEIERRHPDIVALVSDARTGRPLGGVRVSEARLERHAPGSLFKIAIAIAALEGNGRSASTHRCTGHDTIDGTAYRCWDTAGHGELSLRDAIARSCNLYFRALGRTLSRTSLASRASTLGLLPRDHAATIDDATLLGSAAAVTPEMLMSTALTLASRGRLSRPTMSLSGHRYRPLYDGLRECVRSGTARAAWSARTSIAGKTGTVDRAGSPGRHAGWFIGFAPFDRPQYAVVVLHRNGMGSDAAVIAREILEALL
jgi:cell division protein FtsI/penicillin-binding protein 2